MIDSITIFKKDGDETFFRLCEVCGHLLYIKWSDLEQNVRKKYTNFDPPYETCIEVHET